MMGVGRVILYANNVYTHTRISTHTQRERERENSIRTRTHTQYQTHTHTHTVVQKRTYRSLGIHVDSDGLLHLIQRHHVRFLAVSNYA